MTRQPSLLAVALLQRCPACGKGKLFDGLLNVTERCGVCHLSLKEHEKGDGPAFFAIVAVGFIVTGLAGYVEYAYQPPYWLHAVLWLPLIVILSLYFLRVFKAWLIAMQYRHMGIK
ncbi:MAG: DUF983 domain-containing protein [Alphaproteobacteria bacterium]|nr:DUF983 domain-containing protein [Alphaproteobacteria bacterium]